MYNMCVDSDVKYSRFVGSGKHILLINKDIEFSTNIVEAHDDSIVYRIQLSMNDSLSIFVFGLYLPSDNLIQVYNDCVQYIEELYNFNSKLGNVIFAGDFNAQDDTIPVSHIAQRISGLIKQLMRSNSLIPINKTEICTSQSYTFAPLKTTIDYVVVSESFCDYILLCKVFSTDYSAILSVSQYYICFLS